MGVNPTAESGKEEFSHEWLTFMALSIIYFVSFSAFLSNALKFKELIGDDEMDYALLDEVEAHMQSGKL